MDKISNILLSVSALLLLGTFVLVMISNKEPEQPSQHEVIRVDVPSESLELKTIVGNKNIRFYPNGNIHSANLSPVVIHTLRALSCSNCVFDTELLVSHLDSSRSDITQYIWYIDEINPFSISVGRDHSKGKTYLIGNDTLFSNLFEHESIWRDRMLLIFKNGKLTGKVLLPYRIEFYEETDKQQLLNSITKEVEYEITN